jgi:antitoxin MazE
MKVKITRIGNSKGIRIPKPILEQLRIEKEVELETDGDSLIIRPTRELRKGWDVAFKKMAQKCDDKLILGDDPHSSKWDENEWQW